MKVFQTWTPLHEYEFRSGQGKRADICPNEQKLDTHVALAREAGIGGGSPFGYGLGVSI
ncbi:hypothetical protein [Lysinibacillus mangiferihumi]|uniref:hypothetical protein n=1 Tax=Lysinibacillus mangiferihumi TaxID=1130819 RepID=UPI00142DCDE0|nr:hypothetical protein [Lysinibacillus mangiferihumi]